MPSKRIWTETKARFVAKYLNGFVMVTRHGTYIDGFAGPQDPNDLESWTASLVLQSQPQWLDRFRLCDLDGQQVLFLEQLKTQHADRDIKIRQGDFNKRVYDILVPELVPKNRATFCLLDQRTFECKWQTVVTLADYQRDSGHKIEILYFLAEWWFARTFGGMSDPNTLQRVADWWGRDDWKEAARMRGPRRLELLKSRFVDELGYGWVNDYAIYSREHAQGRVAYYMIHASDHPAAARLMRDAYKAAISPPPVPPQLKLE